ncbi:MBL fold metallo-hydrolase [Virgibacillus pantothenticus]|uniref:MBL fold metallo-hydrolase n=2 Tax=Virgibacillus pantothenticus TaxID=1473 RepID=UPI0020B33CA0|nr:MBL fold metallo-hydrolase [Virgibacillus pantothenticus]MEB5455596.1 MBL fold metallo-hydrolase [Virgibacillus pantothenticus]MEB5467676.1 MBL fold metallo-hydrolase [Virgibacillus pantothenticus]
MNDDSVGGIKRMKVIEQTISQITLPTPFAVGDVHVYMLAGDTLSIVDAGVKTKEAWEALTTQLKELGYRPNDIEQIIITHHHPDHIGLTEQFPKAKRISAHPNVDRWLTRDQQYLAHYMHFFEQYFIESGIPKVFYHALDQLEATMDFAGKGEVTIPLVEGDTLPGHPDWKVVETKGHAQSHLSFLRVHDHLLIGGDHILQHISSNPIMEPPEIGKTIEYRPQPMLQYRKNLQKCIDIGVKKVLPGHGEIVEHPQHLIFSRLAKQEERADYVYDILQQSRCALTPYEICTKLFPKQFKKQIDLTMSETIGQLDYLESLERVRKRKEDGKIVYEASIIDK